MANLRAGVVITRVIAGTLGAAVAAFAGLFTYLMIKAILGTSFDMSLTTNTSGIESSFTVYGFISIEACFLGVIVYLGYTTIRNALKPKVIPVEIDE